MEIGMRRNGRKRHRPQPQQKRKLDQVRNYACDAQQIFSTVQAQYALDLKLPSRIR